MDSQTLSRWLDTTIAELLAQKIRIAYAGRKLLRVLITGDDINDLPATLSSLIALDRAGVGLWVGFSHSASQDKLKRPYVQALGQHCAGVAIDGQPIPALAREAEYDSLFLPALSANSLGKIALGLRDNLAGEWVFHALRRQKQIIATLNGECLSAPQRSGLPPALLTRLARYADTLEQYGIVVLGDKIAGSSTAPSASNRPQAGATPCGPPVGAASAGRQKRLISLSDVRLHTPGENLVIDTDTLITPAARDEIRRRKITVSQAS